MREIKAIKAMEAVDQDKWAVHNSVIQVVEVIRDYIPRACHREVENRLFDAFFINGVELTSQAQRKEYEMWKKTQLNIFGLTNVPPSKT